MDQSFVTRLVKLCDFVLHYGNSSQSIYANSFKERLKNHGDLTPKQLQTLSNLIKQVTHYLAEIEDMEKLASKMLKSEQSQLALRLLKSG